MHRLGIARFVVFLVEHLRGGGEFRQRIFVLVLFEKGVAEVIVCLVAILVFLQTAAVVDLRFGVVLLLVLAVAFAHIAGFFLGEGVEADEQQEGDAEGAGTRKTEMFSKDVHFRDSFVLAVEDKEVDDEQKQGDQSKALELLVIVRVDLRLDLLRRQFVEFFLDRLRGRVGVVAAHINATSGLRNLAAHVFV